MISTSSYLFNLVLNSSRISVIFICYGRIFHDFYCFMVNFLCDFDRVWTFDKEVSNILTCVVTEGACQRDVNSFYRQSCAATSPSDAIFLMKFFTFGFV